MAFVGVGEVNLRWITVAASIVTKSIMMELAGIGEAAMSITGAAIRIFRALEPTKSFKKAIKTFKALELAKSFEKEAQNSKATKNSLKLP